MKLDILAFGPHPDDVELLCGGTVAKLVRLGYEVGLVDLTAGEMGTRGSEGKRFKEAEKSAQILGVKVRENLHLPDGGLNSRDYEQRHLVVEAIRKYRPGLVICPAARDRHPDHAQGAALVEEACFLANVGKYPSDLERHKVEAIMRYPMWWHPEADLIVDVSDTWSVKMESVAAYGTQFYKEGVDGPATFLSSPQFVRWIHGRGAHYGAIIGVAFGEPWLLRNPVPVGDPFQLLVYGAGQANP